MFLNGRTGLDGIEAHTQGSFLVAVAIVPWAALKAHRQNVIADEMRLRACLQQTSIRLVCSKVANFIGRVNSGPCKGCL